MEGPQPGQSSAFGALGQQDRGNAHASQDQQSAAAAAGSPDGGGAASDPWWNGADPWAAHGQAGPAAIAGSARGSQAYGQSNQQWDPQSTQYPVAAPQQWGNYGRWQDWGTTGGC